MNTRSISGVVKVGLLALILFGGGLVLGGNVNAEVIGVVIDKVFKFAIYAILTFMLSAFLISVFFALVLNTPRQMIGHVLKQDNNDSCAILLVSILLSVVCLVLGSGGNDFWSYVGDLLLNTALALALSTISIPIILKMVFGIKSQNDLIESIREPFNNNDAWLIAGLMLACAALTVIL